LIGWGGYWRWVRAPLLVERVWIRRGRCAACRRSHALVPDLVLLRRLDVVTVIGTALVRKVLDGLGLRPIAEQVDVPLTTLRSWWQRFRARSSLLLSTCTRLVVMLDGTPVDADTVGEWAAVEVLGLAWQRAHTRFGASIGGSVWAFWSTISGGLGLGTHTTSPWAAVPGADWFDDEGSATSGMSNDGTRQVTSPSARSASRLVASTCSSNTQRKGQC
jgi:hypothetical protein